MSGSKAMTEINMKEYHFEEWIRNKENSKLNSSRYYFFLSKD